MPENNSKGSRSLTMPQIEADILMAESAIEKSKSSKAHLAKYLRGLASYHLQQAAEKLIKIQIYASDVELNNTKIYKHNLVDLLGYAEEIGIQLILPNYINRNALTISGWEAEGRYDVHFVVRTTTLEKCSSEIKEWFNELKTNNYR